MSTRAGLLAAGPAADVEIAAAHKGTPTGPLVSPDDAEKGTHWDPISYFCPDCKCELIVRHGKVRVWHFAHKGDRPVGCNGYSQETWQHKLGKDHVKNQAARSVFVFRYTAECGHATEPDLVFRGRDATSVDTERPLLGGKYRSDVLFTFPDARQLDVEIYHTHAVEATKQRDLEEAGIIVIEIDATSVIQRYIVESAEDVVWMHTETHGMACIQCTERRHREAEVVRIRLDEENKKRRAEEAKRMEDERMRAVRIADAISQAKELEQIEAAEDILACAIRTAEIYARRMEEERIQREEEVVRIRLYEENKKRLAEERERLRYYAENKKRLAEEREWSRRIEELESVIKSTNAKDAIRKRRMPSDSISDENISMKRSRDAVYRLCKCGTSIMTPSIMCKTCAQRRNLVSAEIVERGSYFFGTYTPKCVITTS